MSEAARLSVVTGGSRGIGRAFVLEAVRRGRRVVFSYRSRDADARETDRLAAELGGEAQGLRADLTTKQGIATLADAARAMGETSLLVYNAGVSEECTLEEMTPEAWDGRWR